MSEQAGDKVGRSVIGREYRALVDVAVILVGAGAGAVASILTAYATYRLTARQDQRKWRAELAEKYALLTTDQPRAAQALARQFAVGVLIIERGDAALREKVFIAPYTRMTEGRAEDNEIVLPRQPSKMSAITAGYPRHVHRVSRPCCPLFRGS